MLMLVLPGFAARGAPVTADWYNGNPSLVTGPNSVDQTTNGVTVKAQGYVAEFSGGTSTIFGPFPTTNGIAGFQVFGTFTSQLAHQIGLGLLAQPIGGIAVSGAEFGGGAYNPGIDNWPYYSDNPDVAGDRLPKLEFVLFSFSQPVDVSAVTVASIGNGGLAIWAAGGSAMPDFSDGLSAALAGYAVVNSPHMTVPALTHAINFASIRYLLVGAPPAAPYGDTGLLTPSESRFYITSLDLAPSAGGAVPEPSTALLLAVGGVMILSKRWLPFSR